MVCGPLMRGIEKEVEIRVRYAGCGSLIQV